MNFRDLYNKSGVTLIELLLVVSILAILAGSTTPLLSRFILKTNLESTKNNMVGSLRKAQEYAMDGKNNEAWGICLTSGNIRLFSQSCSSPTYAENYAVPSTISVSSFTPITFNKRGEPDNPQTITLSSTTNSFSVEINSLGGISFP